MLVPPVCVVTVMAPLSWRPRRLDTVSFGWHRLRSGTLVCTHTVIVFAVSHGNGELWAANARSRTGITYIGYRA